MTNPTPEPAGYIVAGEPFGRLTADYDGEIHLTREAGDTALAECHAAGYGGYALYALTPITVVTTT